MFYNRIEKNGVLKKWCLKGDNQMKGRNYGIETLKKPR